MVTRLLLACALGLTLATVSLDAHAGKGDGNGGGGGGIGGGGGLGGDLGARLERRAGVLLIFEGILDLFAGNSEGLTDIAQGEELIQEAVSEIHSRGK